MKYYLPQQSSDEGRRDANHHGHPNNSVSTNEEWAIDFMCDAPENGRRFRTLDVIDNLNRSRRAFSIPARKATAFLYQLIERHRKHKRDKKR